MTTDSGLRMLEWLAGIGAAGAAELAGTAALSEATATARLRVMAHDGLVQRTRLLAGQPALWVITQRGLSEAGRAELGVARVSHAGFIHLLACARVARALEDALGGKFTVHSERELRHWERGGPLIASVELGYGRAPDLHRPDLVCVALERAALPIAIEVELTVKAPARLTAIVRGWARSRRVAGAVYYATPAGGAGARARNRR